MSFISQLFGRRKKKDGGCPKCGFDLGGVSGVVSSSTIACPSCGTDISGHIDFYDLRDDHERRIEQEALRDLGGEDEKLAKEIVDLQSQREVRLHTSPAGHTQFQNSDSLTVEARKRIRRIGVAIGANGGDERMRRIAYRVQALGGSARQLEHSWSGICDWEARREILETAMEKQRGLRARTASTPVKSELNLMSRGMFSETDMNTLRKAIASMAICAPESIKMDRSGAHSEYLEGDLSKIVGRLTDIIREDSKLPDLSRLLARSTDDRSDVFINISTWLKPTETGAQATVWSYTIRRKTNDIYCLSVV